MFANKIRAGIAVTALVASGLAVGAPALADPAAPGPNAAGTATSDYVGVGSDTTQIVMNDLAGNYNTSVSNTSPLLASWDACVQGPTTCVAGGNITLRQGPAGSGSTATTIARPNGSGAGKALLFGAGNNTNVDFARSSAALSATEASNGLIAYPFAADYLVTVTANTSNAPSALSIGQVLGIYNGTFTNWSQLGGANGTIKPYIPQTGSGTRNFFIAQLTAANGGVAPTLATTVTETQEHDPTAIRNDPNAVAPFSRGRAQTGSSAGTVRIENGWIAQRAIYNVVRNGAPTGLKTLFGTTGFLCTSTTAQATITGDGFLPLNNNTCGVANTTSNASAISVANSPVKPASTLSVALSPSVRAIGSAANAVVTVTGGGSGIVSINGRGFAVAGAVSGNQAVIPIPTTLAAGTYPITANYSGNADFQGSTATGTLTVTRANGAISAVKVKLTKAKKHKKSTTYTATVRVGAAGVTPTGAVVIKKGRKTVGVGSVRNGVATIKIKITKLKKGKNKLSVNYLGDGNVNAVTKNIMVKRK